MLRCSAQNGYIWCLFMGSVVEYLLAIGYTVLFLWVIHRMGFFRRSGISFRWLAGIFILKIAAGVLLSLVYTFYYPDRATADVFRFFDDGKVMYEALKDTPQDYFQMLFGVDNDNAYFSEQYYQRMNSWIRTYETNLYNDSHTLVRFNALIHLLSFGFFQVHTVVMCFLSLLGLTALYRSFSGWMADRKPALLLGVFALPSVVFRGSGVLKEGLLFFGFGLLVYGALRLIETKHWKYLPLALLGGGTLLILKFYILLALIPGLIAYGGYTMIKRGRPWMVYALTYLGLTVLVLLFNSAFPQYDIFILLARKQLDFFGHAQLTQSGSLLEATTLAPNLWGLVRNAPEALYFSWLRPLPWEANSPLMWPNIVENLLLLGLAIWGTVHLRKLSRTAQNQWLFLGSFFVLLFLLVGWTTPVMGAIVRYKVPALPFYALFFLMLVRKERLPKMLQSSLS
ncbi:MAG: hypothetical protein ACFB10_22675 [Salibacteraceae bacterium]